ncbi:MAG: hypothetical protein NTW19_21535 [Planctomycetota bacterium]|nr:hypothetical protein [Planctomycetota bacterium]
MHTTPVRPSSAPSRWPAPLRLAMAALALLACLLAVPARARACDTPVFRYALERWAPDAYQALFFHRGELTTDQARLIDKLRAMTAQENSPANMQVQAIDLAKTPDPVIESAYAAAGRPAAPCLVLTYPLTRVPVAVAWSGPLDDNSVAALAVSPARKEIAKRIVAGDSIVWVVLESGDVAKDTATHTRLKELLEDLQQAATPESTDGRASATPSRAAGEEAMGDTQDAGPASTPVRFSTLRLSRKDPAEAIFIAMLLRSEPDIDKLTDTMAFPIFGQGRILHAIVGRGINAANVGQSVSLLTGPCSCEIKDQNPGTDMLVAADWRVDRSYIPDAKPELTSLAAAAENAGKNGSTTQPAGEHGGPGTPGEHAAGHPGMGGHGAPGGHGTWAAMGPVVVVLTGLIGGALLITFWIVFRSPSSEA